MFRVGAHEGNGVLAGLARAVFASAVRPCACARRAARPSVVVAPRAFVRAVRPRFRATLPRANGWDAVGAPCGREILDVGSAPPGGRRNACAPEGAHGWPCVGSKLFLMGPRGEHLHFPLIWDSCTGRLA